MAADAWFKMLFVSLVALGFTLPFMVYFVDVYKGRRVFPIPIMGPIQKLIPWSLVSDRCRLQSPSPYRKLLRQTQGVQADRPARRQNRSKLHSHDPPRRRAHQFAMNLNKP